MVDDSQPVYRKDWSATLKTAAIVWGVNFLLTGFKFLIYWVSGSLAVLAEAWHSFTDIATSGLVFFAIFFSTRKTGQTEGPGQGPEGPRHVSVLEIAASVCIGLLLLTVSGLLFTKLLGSDAAPIRSPLLSGITFIVFAVASYLISTFETQMGKTQASLGLISDGMHAKADMLASLLTGLSLILYAMGVNIDKWMAGAVATVMLLLSLDTFVNAFRVVKDKNGKSLYNYRFLNAILSVFTMDNLTRLPRYGHAFLVNRLGDRARVTRLYNVCLFIPVAYILYVYGSTACYTVAVNETAIVERFGSPSGKPMGPGFHLKLPWPVDKVVKVGSASIRSLDIGNTASTRQAFIWTVKHGSEEAFLTGNNNFFYPYITLHYRIRDPFKFLYNHRDPEQLLNEVGHRAAVCLFAGQSFYDIATTKRGLLQEKMKQSIQQSLNRHDSGIELVSVNFRDIHPPISIAKSFEEVVAAFQDKQETINQAIGYANSVIPQSRGDADKNVQSARGYSVHRLSQAQGEARRFELRLPATHAEKNISMERLYRETMTQVLKDKTKIIVDPNAGIPDIWMNFNNTESNFSEVWSRSDREPDDKGR